MGRHSFSWAAAIPLAVLHLLPFGLIFTGMTGADAIMALIFFWARMFLIGAVFHRYLAHRSYKMGRKTQFVMTAATCTSFESGPLWWAANHRHHHAESDTEHDIHSPRFRGLWWAHLGWVISGKHADLKAELIPDFLKFPEMRFLERWNWVPGVLASAVILFFMGWSGFFAFFLSTVVLHHVTYCVNSLNHVWGSQRYDTGDTSRNNALIAFFTMGEGWHNNHHHFQSSARQGFFWWEWDPTYYILKLMEKVGLVERVLVVTPTGLVDKRLR
jgi:stearoyl-CoA desaturase (delta-9 desaturase)